MGRRRIKVRCTSCGRTESIRLEIVLRGGFIGAGWLCTGGTRVCPPCQNPAPAETNDDD